MPKRKDFSLETVDLAGVEIAAADVTVHGGGSPPEGDTYSIQDLERIAADSNKVADDLRPPVKLGHDRKQRLLRASGLWGEEPRTGTLKSFRVRGDKLLCDIKDMPKKLADLVESGAFRLRSMELGPARSQRTNETYDTVVKGLALLGATTPAFQTLDDIHALYAGADRGNTRDLLFQDSRLEADDLLVTNYAVGDVIWDEEDGVNDIMGDISARINPDSPDVFPRYWVMDLQLVDVDGDGDVPGPRALIGEYGNGAAWVVPITFDEQGEPIVPPSSDWVLAEQAWVQVSDDPNEGRDMRDRENRDGDDTTGVVKLKVKIGGEEREVELPDLDENQVKVFNDAHALGLEGDDLTAEKVYTAMFEKAEQPAPPSPTPAPPSPAPTPPAPTPPSPERTMSDQEFAELKDRAERGDRAFEQLRVDRRDSYLLGLVRSGRLNPADVDDWRRDYDENETATRRVLDRLPVNDELLRVYGGDGDGLEYSDQDEAMYRAYCANQGIPYASIGGTA